MLKIGCIYVHNTTLSQNSRVIQLYFKISVVTKVPVNGHFLSMVPSQNDALLDFVSNIPMAHFYILRKFNSCYSNTCSTGRQWRKIELKTKVKRCGCCLYSAKYITFYWDSLAFPAKICAIGSFKSPWFPLLTKICGQFLCFFKLSPPSYILRI